MFIGVHDVHWRTDREAKRKSLRSELLNWNLIHKSASNQQPAADSSLWNRLTSSTLWWLDSRFVRFGGWSCKHKCIMGTNNNIYDKQSRWIKVYVGKGPPVSTVATRLPCSDSTTLALSHTLRSHWWTRCTLSHASQDSPLPALTKLERLMGMIHVLPGLTASSRSNPLESVT